MQHLSKHLWLAGGALALAWCLWVWRDRLGNTNAPAASLGQPSVQVSEKLANHGSTPRPRVLQANRVGLESAAQPSEATPTQQQPAAELGDHPYPPASVFHGPGRTEFLPAEAMDATQSPREAVPSHAAASPATPERPSVLAMEAAPRRLVTQDQDSFWSISEQAYGTGAYYRALFRHNRLRVLRPDQLRAGLELEIPSPEQLRQLYPEDCPR